MACMVGGDPEDFLPPAEPTDEEIRYAQASEEKYQALRAEMKNAKPAQS